MKYHNDHFKLIKVRVKDRVCFIQLNRVEHGNTLNDKLITEFHDALERCEREACVVVVEGLPTVFCDGADFSEISEEKGFINQNVAKQKPLKQEKLYGIWLKLVKGSFVSVAHVRGRTNAAGMGFVAACDIVIADDSATFSLSEMLFGLYPALVLPFLIRKIGLQKAHYLTLSTKTINAEIAKQWGLVDALDRNSKRLLALHISRLKLISKSTIERYKRYTEPYTSELLGIKEHAIQANQLMFSDETSLSKISSFVKEGVLPWDVI